MSKELNHRITGLAQWGDVVVTASGCPAMLYLHERGRLLGRLRGHSGRADVLCAVGPTLLSVGSDGCGRTVRVWDLVRRAAVGALGPLGPAERVTCMCHPPTYLNKVVLGLAVVLAVKEGLKLVFSALGFTWLGTNAIRYFAVVLMAATVWPLTFRFFARLGKKKQ